MVHEVNGVGCPRAGTRVDIREHGRSGLRRDAERQLCGAELAVGRIVNGHGELDLRSAVRCGQEVDAVQMQILGAAAVQIELVRGEADGFVVRIDDAAEAVKQLPLAGRGLREHHVGGVGIGGEDLLGGVRGLERSADARHGVVVADGDGSVALIARAGGTDSGVGDIDRVFGRIRARHIGDGVQIDLREAGLIIALVRCGQPGGAGARGIGPAEDSVVVAVVQVIGLVVHHDHSIAERERDVVQLFVGARVLGEGLAEIGLIECDAAAEAGRVFHIDALAADGDLAGRDDIAVCVITDIEEIRRGRAAARGRLEGEVRDQIASRAGDIVLRAGRDAAVAVIDGAAGGIGNADGGELAGVAAGGCVNGGGEIVLVKGRILLHGEGSGFCRGDLNGGVGRRIGRAADDDGDRQRDGDGGLGGTGRIRIERHRGRAGAGRGGDGLALRLTVKGGDAVAVGLPGDRDVLLVGGIAVLGVVLIDCCGDIGSRAGSH